MKIDFIKSEKKLSFLIKGCSIQFFPFVFELYKNDNIEVMPEFILTKKNNYTLSLDYSSEAVNIKGGCDINIRHDRIYFDYDLIITSFKKNAISHKVLINVPETTWDDVDYYLPGFWYKKNRYTPENAPTEMVSHKWIVREDRISSPLVGMFNKKDLYYISLLKTSLPTVDKKLDKTRGKIVIDNKETDIYSIGFNDSHNSQNLLFYAPFREESFSYQRKGNIKSIKKQNYIKSYINIHKKEVSLKYSFILTVDKVESFSAMVDALNRLSFTTFQPKPLNLKWGINEFKNLLSNYHKNTYIETEKIAGYWASVGIKSYSCKPAFHIMEIGFVGRTLLNASNYLRWNRIKDNKIESLKSIIIIDKWCHNACEEKTGLFYCSWDYKKDKPKYKEFFFTRLEAEAFIALIKSYKNELEIGEYHKFWKEKIIKGLNSLINFQLRDGSFARAYFFNGKIKELGSGGAVSSVIPLLVEAFFTFPEFRDKRIMDSIENGIQFVCKNVIERSDFYGSTIDADCEDKEAAFYALRTALSAYNYYKQKGNKEVMSKMIKYAKISADFLLSWFFMYDVPFDKDTLLGKIGLKTRGWGIVSTENNHIDVYMFEMPADLMLLSKLLNDNFYEKMAILLYSSMSQQLVTAPDNFTGVKYNGFVPEVVQQTLWDYGKYGKGYYNWLAAYGWTNASVWYATDTLIDFFGSNANGVRRLEEILSLKEKRRIVSK